MEKYTDFLCTHIGFQDLFIPKNGHIVYIMNESVII